MALTITGVVPAMAPTTGGAQCRVTGTDLNTVTSVKVDTTEAPFSILGPTMLLVTAPPHAAGSVGVTVQAGAGSPQTLAAALTYAVPSDTAPLTSTLARKFAIDVDLAPVGQAAVWRKVRAVTELTPKVDSTLQDDSDYDSDGWASQTVTMLAWSLEATVARKVDLASNLYDPGQEKLRQAATSFGAAGTVHVRWYDRSGGPEAYEGYAVVTWEPQGGGADALDTAKVTLTGQGRRVVIVNPVAA